MSIAKGTYMGGIRSISDLRDRCRIDEVTGCWHWSQCVDNGAPKLWFTDAHGQTSMRGRRAALSLLNGERLPKEMVAYPTRGCESSDCVNPDHACAGSRVKAGKALAKSGRIKGLPSKTAASRKTCAKLRKLTDEMVAEIRSSDESIVTLAKKFGVAQNTVWMCRAGRSYKPPGASVFTWRPA